MQLDSSQTAGAYAGGNSLSQTISLTSGVQYHLTFYMSAEAGLGQATTTLAVILNGGGFSNFMTSFTVSATGTDTKSDDGRLGAANTRFQAHRHRKRYADISRHLHAERHQLERVAGQRGSGERPGNSKWHCRRGLLPRAGADEKTRPIPSYSGSHPPAIAAGISFKGISTAQSRSLQTSIAFFGVVLLSFGRDLAPGHEEQQQSPQNSVVRMRRFPRYHSDVVAG
jgi:hypothetical protein